MKMKHVVILTLMMGFGAHADTLGTKFGLQMWQPDMSGYVGEATDATLSWKNDGEQQFRLYGVLEHPGLFIPNLKLGYARFDFDDSAQLTQTYRLGDQLYSIGSVVDFGGEYEVLDFIAYYEIIDRNILSFDLGINFRFQETEYSIVDVNSGINSTANVSNTAPMLFARLQSGLPLLGISSYLEYQSGDKNSDFEGAIGYQFANTSIADTTVFLGYKSQQITHEFIDGIYSKAELESVFVALEIDF